MGDRGDRDGLRAGLWILAIAATAAHFVVVLVYPRLVAKLPRSRYVGFRMRVVYEDGRGILRRVLTESTSRGFSIDRVDTRPLEQQVAGVSAVAVAFQVRGQPSVDALSVALDGVDGVLEVTTTDLAQTGD